MASGSTRGRKFSSWARRERVAEGSFSAVARGTPGARGASWPNETREEPWSAPRTLAAVEPRSVCFAPRASDGVMTETTGCLALPRDTLEVRLTSAAVRLRLDVGGDEIFVASDHGPAMIDSGAELLMLPLATADFRASSGVLVLGTRQTTRGERGETASLRLADDATAGAVTLRNVPTAVVPSFAEVLSRAGLQPSTAILGLPLLASVAMRVDYVKREVVLGAPPHRPGAIAVPLRYEDGHMVVDASLEGQSVALILDTGSGDGLSIDKTWADAHGLPGSRRHADVPMGEAAGMSVTTRFRLEHASFGPVAFDGRLADIHPMPRSSRYAGMLGNPMLERCHAFVLDLPARTLWLEGPCDRPVRERRGGFSFERRYATDTTEMAGGVRVGGFWEVATMMPGGPAARADLRVGDRILSMAGVRAPLRADDWVDVLSQAAGTVIGLKVERDGQPIALALRLDDFP